MLKLCSCALMLFLLVSSAASICMKPQPRLVCAEFFREQAVVIARLVRVRHVAVDPTRDDATDHYFYTMQTDRVLRGSMGGTFRVYEEMGTTAALFEWKPGERYLLFISYSRDLHGWVLDECGNSGPLRESAEALKTIDGIKTAKDGGVISGETWPGTGVTIVVKGTGGKFQTRSDSENKFQVRVPAGVYTVRAALQGARFVAEPLSYEKPHGLRVANGGCAQIMFTPLEPEKPERRRVVGPVDH